MNIFKLTKSFLLKNFIFNDYKELSKLENNTNDYFNYLFSNLNWDILSKFITYMINYDEYLDTIMNNLYYLLRHADEKVLDNMLFYLMKHNITNEMIIDTIKKESSNIDKYVELLNRSKNRVTEYKKIFENSNKNLYILCDKLQDNILNSYKFETNIIYPLSFSKINEYIDYSFNKLNLNINDFEYISNGKGSYGWCFKNGDYVLKIATRNVVWNIPMFYRINDFILRKQFGDGLLSLCPYGDKDGVTNDDIKNALADFMGANVVLTDKNYKDNFAVVDYDIPDNIFRDVDGIREYINVPYSINYEKKKVKLIDQDYLYLTEDKIKKIGVYQEKWI